MKILKKAVISGSRTPIMANNQTVSVKVFLSYPKPTRKKKRKSSIKRVPNRNSFNHLQSPPASDEEILPDDGSLTMEDSLFDTEDPYTTTTPTPSSYTDSSFPTSSTPDTSQSLSQEGDDWGDFLNEDGNATSSPLFVQNEKKTNAGSPLMNLSEPSSQIDLSTNSAYTPAAINADTLPTRFHTQEQIAVPITEPSFPLMQMDISTIDECSYYILLHSDDAEHKVMVYLEISPDGEHFVRQEEKELNSSEMLVLSPQHVAHFTRLFIIDDEGKSPSAQLDIYFQYRTSMPNT